MKQMITNFIPQNIATPTAKKIGLYNSQGVKVCDIPLGRLSPNVGEKVYSVGVISDIHLPASTAEADFERAMDYFTANNVDFTAICGDLTVDGTDAQLQLFLNYLNQYGNIEVVTGNHDGRVANISSRISTYTGKPLYSSFEHKGDVYILLGIKQDAPNGLFEDGELQWLYETLEANRNKRCFVFQHVRPDDVCGNAFGLYQYDIWNGTETQVFKSLMQHYSNVIMFHGHSHLKLDLQTKHNLANYDNNYGCHSVHIPSLAYPRGDSNMDGSYENMYAESEGYLMDVYPNHIILRGIDFVGNKFIPIGQYCLDTTLKTIEANTYTDSTGTITV